MTRNTQVDTRANKTLVKQAVEAAFDVKVKNVNIVNVRAKFKRMGKYADIQKRRKAIVTLTEDSKINYSKLLNKLIDNSLNGRKNVAIKKYKPTSNGRRNMTGSDFAEITTSTPEKSLLQPLKNHAGRNNNGRITVRHQGGGHKRQYRVIDFKRNKDNVVATVQTIEYDPNRSANIALVHYEEME